ncbi:MAG: phage tail protein [Desulfobulbaceae bacterium]|nr:phage tail protein [Desulfobulbaceae bacterium]
MSDPFIGEIRAFAFTYAPYGWATCDGQAMQIVQNQALYSILGTYFGGDGRTYFNLPNFSGRAPMNAGAGPGLTPRNLGQSVGAASVSLAGSNFPPHNHGLNVVSNTPAGPMTVANNYLSKGNSIVGGKQKAVPTYLPAPVTAPMAADAVQQAGTANGPVPHDNMQPYLPVLLCIALQGIYPSRP